MGNCKSCKHWGALTDTHVLRRCGAVEGDHAAELVYLSGDYGYEAQLLTGADFGCVLHETAPASEPAHQSQK